MPDEYFILDYLGDSVLDDFELLGVGFQQAESVPGVGKANCPLGGQSGERPFFFIFFYFGPTRTEMG